MSEQKDDVSVSEPKAKTEAPIEPKVVPSPAPIPVPVTAPAVKIKNPKRQEAGRKNAAKQKELKAQMQKQIEESAKIINIYNDKPSQPISIPELPNKKHTQISTDNLYWQVPAALTILIVGGILVCIQRGNKIQTNTVPSTAPVAKTTDSAPSDNVFDW